MSVRVILTPEIREHSDSVVKRNTNVTEFQGIQIASEGSMTYAFLGLDVDEAEVNPAISDRFIIGFSAKVFVKTTIGRTEGVYVYNGAVGTVTDCVVNIAPTVRNPGYWVFIRSTKLSDMKELYRRIRAGTLVPIVSYEGAQRTKAQINTTFRNGAARLFHVVRSFVSRNVRRGTSMFRHMKHRVASIGYDAGTM